jgi:hypothetical protein
VKAPQYGQFLPVSQILPLVMTIDLGTAPLVIPCPVERVNPLRLQNSSAAGFPQSFAHVKQPSSGTPPMAGLSNLWAVRRVCCLRCNSSSCLFRMATGRKDLPRDIGGSIGQAGIYSGQASTRSPGFRREACLPIAVLTF